MSYDLTETEEAPISNEQILRSEFGWLEVKNGLGRILGGYLVFLAGTTLCVGMTVYAVIGLSKPAKGNELNLTYLWLFYIGTGFQSLVTLLSYVMVLRGKWACLMNAPERRGAKWLMFACMTCLLFGPGINLASWIYGVDKRPEFKKGADGLKELHFTKFGGGLQIASSAVAISHFIFFLLFLRAIAHCFEDRGRLVHVMLFMLLFAGLYGGSLYVVLGRPELLLKKELLIGLGATWLLGFLWYLGLIFSFRTCIDRGMTDLRSPLDLA